MNIPEVKIPKVHEFNTQQVEEENEYFRQWRKIWREESLLPEEQDIFLKKFTANYVWVYPQIKFNKDCNFLLKKVYCLLIATAALAIMVATLVMHFWLGTILSKIIIGDGIIAVFFTLLLVSLTKWIDIKKYQETWVRHHYHQYALDFEMQKYICRLEPYDNPDKRKENFMKKSFEIWEKDEEKFTGNMENKEKDLSEVLKYIKMT